MITDRYFIYINSRNEKIFIGLSYDFVSNLDSVSSNSISFTTSVDVGQIGETITSKHVQSKPITFNGFIKTDGIENRNKLLNVIVPGDNGKLIAVIENEEKLYINCTPSSTPAIENTDCKPKFQFTLQCEYPFWRTLAEEQMIIFGLIPLFRYPRNFSGIWKWSEYQLSEFINVENTGNQQVGLKLIIKGSNLITDQNFVNTFQLQNIETLKIIKFKPNYTIRAGETIEITTGYNNKKAISSINGNILKYLDITNDNFEFIQLTPGNNIFKYTANGKKELLEVKVQYDLVKVGI